MIPHIDMFRVIGRGAALNRARGMLFAIAVTTCWTPLAANAQFCKGNINTGCTNPGAVCKPVMTGAGPTGHCQTPGGEPPGEKECRCEGTPIPPPPDFDAGCSDRTAQGTFTCTIHEPKVNQHETDYPNVEFAPGDVIQVTGNGCVQTGGWGATWKRYVNPSGPNAGQYYHGLVRIPTATETKGALVRINTVIGKSLHVTGTGLPLSQLYLHLGYEDDDYSDNGYSGHDDGTDGQCKITAADPPSGGPAYVVVTIYRGTAAPPPQSNYDFDVLSSVVDPNGLPYNPSWSWQLRPENAGRMPDTSICHQFSVRESTLGVPDMFMSPSFADCTDQADLSTVDMPPPDSLCWWRTIPYFGSTFAGHVNWFPVTVEGTSDAVSHSGWPYPFGDDDYTFGFTSQISGDPLSVNAYPGLHVEFDSDETIDHFTDNSPNNEWQQLHDAVDNGGNVAQLFAGHTIVTGMYGLDTEHSLKPELHPLFAMATLRDNFENSANDEAWLMFVRNQGDEGYCSMSLWDLGLEDYTFRLPWRAGMASVAVNWDKTFFSGTDGTSGPSVAMIRPAPPPGNGGNNAGVYVTFHLGPPVQEGLDGGSVPFLYGVLHLVWSGQTSLPLGTGPQSHPLIARTIPRGPAAGRVPGRVGIPQVETDEAEKALAASASKLKAAQREQVRKLGALPKMPAIHMHRLQPTGAVREIAYFPRVFRIGRLHAIRGGPATRKVRREATAMRALCTATNNAPPGLPAQVCRSRPAGR